MTDPDSGLMATVARMYYLDELEQREIAGIFGISRSKVSRLLSAARESGIVRISVEPDEPRDRALEERLVARFGLHHAVVIKTIGRASENVRRTVGYFAAPALADLIRPPMRIGIVGGRTLGEMVGFLRPAERRQDLTVVQMMGHIDPALSRFDAPELCRALASRLGAAAYTLNAPVFAADRRARDVFLAHEQLRLVWRLFGELDLALVGVGALEESVFAERGVLHEADFARLRSQGAVGEICARFFDQEGRECASDYRDRAVTIDLDELRRRPEVVAVTTGTRRREAILAAVRGRLITSLVIDQIGAEALLGGDDRREPVTQEGGLRPAPIPA